MEKINRKVQCRSLNKMCCLSEQTKLSRSDLEEDSEHLQLM